jgi:tRNA U34 5-methylaminomethyl-2-thiouridine-forming methyltransferase MnmC
MTDKKVRTADGSITFHSEQYDEHYHSTSGALTEAHKKYAEVCKIYDRKEVDILDICFGLGYNSAAAIDRFEGKSIRIVGLEIYEGIIKQIEMMGHEYPFECFNIMLEVAKKGIYKGPVDTRKVDFMRKEGEADVKLIMGDARETIKTLPDRSFDCAFHDPFSPKKNPELWTKEFFDEVFRVLRKGGMVATYSCARIVRDNFKAAGFTVKDSPPVGRRAPGTIAIKP